jgi:DNA-binding transcriptional LysR family regulator
MNAMTMDYNDLNLFAQVVIHRGFSAAALALGLPKSRVSRHVSRLEAALGSRLLQRTSRQVQLTDAGRVLFQHCEAMLAEARAGEHAVRNLQTEPSGTLRISLPAELSDSVLSPLLPRYMALYPRVHLDVQITNRMVDLVDEGIDVAIRGSSEVLDDASTVLVPLGQVRWALVASPELLAKLGPLADPADISGLPMLSHACSASAVRTQSLWNDAGECMHVPVQVRMQSDNIKVLHEAALAGLGLCGLPAYCCADELRSGTLRTALAGWRPRAGRLVALLPARRGMPLSARLLLDFLKVELPPRLISV